MDRIVDLINEHPHRHIITLYRRLADNEFCLLIGISDSQIQLHLHATPEINVMIDKITHHTSLLPMVFNEFRPHLQLSYATTRVASPPSMDIRNMDDCGPPI